MIQRTQKPNTPEHIAAWTKFVATRCVPKSKAKKQLLSDLINYSLPFSVHTTTQDRGHSRHGLPTILSHDRSLADADASRRRHRFNDVQRRSDLPIEWVWQYADAEQQTLRHDWQGVRA